jgi:hypothetical protein
MMRKLLRSGALLALLALTALASCGADSGNSSTSSSGQPATATSQPSTLTTSSAGLVEQTTPKGTAVQLQGRFESAVIARRNADGSIATECHDEQQQAEAFMQGATATGEVK